jgi:hypothetical protein
MKIVSHRRQQEETVVNEDTLKDVQHQCPNRGQNIEKETLLQKPSELKVNVTANVKRGTITRIKVVIQEKKAGRLRRRKHLHLLLQVQGKEIGNLPLHQHQQHHPQQAILMKLPFPLKRLTESELNWV